MRDGRAAALPVWLANGWLEIGNGALLSVPGRTPAAWFLVHITRMQHPMMRGPSRNRFQRIPHGLCTW